MASKVYERPKTALQQDYSFSAVDDYDSRMYILPQLVDQDSRDAIIAEHKSNPMYKGTQPGSPAPMYSQTLTKLIDKLRVVPQTGKHTIVETKPWEEYTIGILPGHRGGTVKLTEEKYATRGEAEHSIFLKRLKAYLFQYGIDMDEQ
tara:strand:- start:343 stop:783 length:441 start_codon:yes stop_codon:yes gene_type:complete